MCLYAGRAVIMVALVAGMVVGAEARESRWRTDLLEYLDRHLKPGGGYGWEDQPDAHLTPTFAAVGLLYHLNKLPSDRRGLAEFVRTLHPQRGRNREAGPSGTEMRDLVYQQLHTLAWLQADLSAWRPEVEAWRTQAGKRSHFELNGHPVLMQEMMTLFCRELLGLGKAPDAPELIEYLRIRRRPNSSYNNVPTAEGGDGNLLNTYWSLAALEHLGERIDATKDVAAWINACQRKNGGFTHQPNPQIGGNDDIVYAWAAAKALDLLGQTPARLADCIDYVVSLRNSDGGFGPRAGLPSTPMSTYYAIETLQILKRLSVLDSAPPIREASSSNPPDFAGHKVYTVQFEAGGDGSPAEAVMLAQHLGIHLWGAKNATAEWIETAQGIAGQQNVQVTFFRSDEPHENNVHVPGLGKFSHILDYIAPASAAVPFKSQTMSERFRGESRPAESIMTWEKLRQTVIEPLHRAGGGLVLQVSNNEPLARILLDESIDRGGYLAISTIHFGQNFLFWLPYLQQYRHRLPYVALQDFHGFESWWWAGELESYRTVFIARDPTYESMVEAMRRQWVAAIRHDELSDYQTRMLGGTAEARSFIQSRQKEWQWWRDQQTESGLPWGVLTVVESKSKFEVGRPSHGAVVRIRTRWQGLRNRLKEPLTELIELQIDGRRVDPNQIRREQTEGVDSFQWYPLPAAGAQKLSATFRHLKTGGTRTIFQDVILTP